MVTVDPIPWEAVVDLAWGLVAVVPPSIVLLFLPEPEQRLCCPPEWW